MKKEGLVKKFKVGQEAELKSFVRGYRGAWFQFKIINIFWEQNEIKLEYLNYDDGIKTEKIYEVPPYTRKSNPTNKQLMIRPRYPPMYHKNTMPSVISEVCVVTNGSWKVEDLVDSYSNGCFWSGRVTKVLSEDKVQIEYPLPPAGEGEVDESDEAYCKDLRPSLFWSQEEGWILPSMDGRTAGDAQLIFPSLQGTDSEREEANDAEQVGYSTVDAFEKGTDSDNEEFDDAEAVGGSPLDAYGNGISNGTGISSDSLVEGETKIKKAMDAAVCKDVNMDDLESRETNAAAATAAAFKEGIECSIDLNLMHEETLEAPILDLEELANKIRWIKSILYSHQPPSNDKTPWKFA